MSVLSHIALFATYALVAGVIFVVPDVFPTVDAAKAWTTAAFVFLVGALVHEVMARRAREDIFLRRVGTTRRELQELRTELAKAREEAKRVHDAMGAAAPAAPAAGGGARSIDTVVAEVKVLQSLIEQLYARNVRVPAGARRGLSAVVPPDELGGPGDAAAGDMLELVRDALRRDRVDLFLQPIVSLPQRKHRFYECFSRIRTADGALIQPQEYMEIAERAGLMAAIDNLLLFRSVQLVRKTQRGKMDVGFVCNISPYTLSDAIFLGEFVTYIEEHRDLAPKLVLEFPLKDFMAHDAATAEALTRLLQLGVRFSIDQVDDLKLDTDGLARRGVRFVKIPAATLLNELRLDRPNADPRVLKDALDRAGIDLIVEKVESESDLIELLDFQIDFGQGFLFGEPRIAKEKG
jgi:cyclic-di-GMP phosphodiesterase TipF (flagellum assembly factor)